MSTWRDRARELLGGVGDEVLAPQALDEHVRAAVRRFSADSPRVSSVDFAGNGLSYDLAISSIATWAHGFSDVVAIEHPQGSREPQFLDEQEWMHYPIHSQPTAIRLLTVVPATGQTARVYFTVPWPIPDQIAATDQIADPDFDPVATLAASYGATQLAGRSSGHKNPTLPGADVAGDAGEAGRWRQLAEDLEETYRRHTGAAPQNAPASGVTDWDATSASLVNARRYLFRGRR